MKQTKIPPQVLRQAEEAGIPPELLERAAGAESSEELLVLSQELGGALSAQESRTMFSALQTARAGQGTSGELTDEELEGVSGGAGGWGNFLEWLMRLIEMIKKAFGG